MFSHGAKQAIAFRFESTTVRRRHGNPNLTIVSWKLRISGSIALRATHFFLSKKKSRNSAAFPSATQRVLLASEASQRFLARWIRTKPGRAPPQMLPELILREGIFERREFGSAPRSDALADDA